MQIRVANRQDEPTIKSIVNQALRERGKPEIDTTGADHDLSNIDARYFWYDGIFLVAEDEGTIVGLIGARPGDDQSALEVRRLAILPEYRGRGIAARLMDTVFFFAGNLEFKQVLLSPGCHGLPADKAHFGFEPYEGHPGILRRTVTPVRTPSPCH